MEKYIKNRYVFSNWIFVFCILYFIGAINYNPIILIYFSVFVCIIQVFIFIYNNIKLYNLINYLILIVLLHVLPIFLLYNRKINYVYDITISLLILLIYIIYNLLNNQSIIMNYYDLLLNHLDKNKGKPSHFKYIFDKYIFRIS